MTCTRCRARINQREEKYHRTNLGPHHAVCPKKTAITIKPETYGAIRWSRRPSCGEPGCADPECRCAVCDLPIGTREDDPRWRKHDEDCGGCPLCVDQVPIILWRGAGTQMEQAQFHARCFVVSCYSRASIAPAD